MKLKQSWHLGMIILIGILDFHISPFITLIIARNNFLTLIMRVLSSKRHGQNLTKLFLGLIMLKNLSRFGDSFELVSWSILLKFFKLLYSNSFARFRILIATPW